MNYLRFVLLCFCSVNGLPVKKEHGIETTMNQSQVSDTLACHKLSMTPK